MTKERIALGKRGEELASRRLQSLGYEILERNYRCPLGEIDLIARENGTVVFVEIKTRRNRSLAEAKEAVHKKKQGQLSKVALAYLKSKNLWGAKARFDVVAIGIGQGKASIEIVKDAFELAY
ncbi:MAG: YraN family protein [Thermodesulfobacteriota bacterium]